MISLEQKYVQQCLNKWVDVFVFVCLCLCVERQRESTANRDGSYALYHLVWDRLHFPLQKTSCAHAAQQVVYLVSLSVSLSISL